MSPPKWGGGQIPNSYKACVISAIVLKEAEGSNGVSDRPGNSQIAKVIHWKSQRASLRTTAETERSSAYFNSRAVVRPKETNRI